MTRRSFSPRAEFGNKGIGFELILNRTNEAYMAAGLALVHKVPTEWKVLGDWRKGPVQVYPVRKAPCDYLGFTLAGESGAAAREVLERLKWLLGPIGTGPSSPAADVLAKLADLLAGKVGHGLAIEAKESEGDTSFPFNVEWDHEVQFLRQAHRHGADAFMLIHQVKARRVWMLPGPELFTRWDAAFTGTRAGRKSIPWGDLEQGAGKLVPAAPSFPVHYLKLL